MTANLRKWQVEYLENELKFHEEIKRDYEEEYNNILNPSSENETGISSNKISDTTFSNVCLVMSSRALMSAKKSIDNVNRALEIINLDKNLKRFVELNYFKHRQYKRDGVIMQMEISRRQYYRYREIVVDILAKEFGFK